MQVGEMFECGHCHPDKYMLAMPCECKCHKVKVDPTLESRIKALEDWVEKVKDQLI